MRGPIGAVVNWTLVVLILACWILFSTVAAKAQQGQNAVYYSGSPTNSPAFIDASVFGNSRTDICAVLNGILSSVSTNYPAAGAVIDARGLPGTTGTSMTCSASPWTGTPPTGGWPPSTILLPATGTGTSATPIIISSTWILPSNTHLIGEGDDLSGTTIQTLSGTSLAPT